MARDVREVREVLACRGVLGLVEVLVRREVRVVHGVLVPDEVHREVRHVVLGEVLSVQPYRRFFGEDVLILVEEVACHQMV